MRAALEEYNSKFSDDTTPVTPSSSFVDTSTLAPRRRGATVHGAREYHVPSDLRTGISNNPYNGVGNNSSSTAITSGTVAPSSSMTNHQKEDDSYTSLKMRYLRSLNISIQQAPPAKDNNISASAPIPIPIALSMGRGDLDSDSDISDKEDEDTEGSSYDNNSNSNNNNKTSTSFRNTVANSYLSSNQFKNNLNTFVDTDLTNNKNINNTDNNDNGKAGGINGINTLSSQFNNNNTIEISKININKQSVNNSNSSSNNNKNKAIIGFNVNDKNDNSNGFSSSPNDDNGLNAPRKDSKGKGKHKFIPPHELLGTNGDESLITNHSIPGTRKVFAE
ncbi:hypothetical protein DICPUDRAFT_92146 [Dictyostelium purpureum]|uniref:Uncharacterized protein n=1 Tax=Dictyostelium purpureum TaxID=5786 RepID=F0ZMR5_DICPU|nr:uncharacterized protein DICPUDRAFT_92146 [Dictyostelium purpureum]EGC34794.1 hypothetical protein DICPUDRAFT_92146 [Dictyostelium purpureum]|eukprot:XP_003288709.1 hypothetical protein DICPUDRAFT_92146 [Dictyostelium purpureum]